MDLSVPSLVASIGALAQQAGNNHQAERAMGAGVGLAYPATSPPSLRTIVLRKEQGERKRSVE
jgi:hypothetical protein